MTSRSGVVAAMATTDLFFLPTAGENFGHAIFEATHGTAPKYADLDKVNPGSLILSGEMMLRTNGK